MTKYTKSINRKPAKLYYLIKALSGHEKRYFRQFARRHVIGGENDYLQVFDILERQDSYDEALARKNLAGNPAAQHLDVTKVYLYRLILRCMRQYRAAGSAETRLNEMRGDLEFLYGKGLNADCGDIIKKAVALAYKYEKPEHLLELYRWKHRLMHIEQYSDVPESSLKNLFREEDEILAKIQSDTHYRRMAARIFSFIRATGSLRTKKELQALRNIMEDEGSGLRIKNRSYASLNLLYQVRTAYYYSLAGDYPRAYHYAGKRLELMERHPHQIREDLHAYVYALNNYLILALRANQYGSFPEKLTKLRAIPAQFPGSKNLYPVLFARSYARELGYYLDRAEFRKGMKCIPEIEKGLSEYGGLISPLEKKAFYYNIAYLCFGTGDYGRSLAWLNRLLNEQPAAQMEDIDGFARIFNMILHYELGHDDLLEYLTKSTYHFLRRRKRLYRTESCLLGFIRKTLASGKGTAGLENAFRELIKELEAISRDPFEKAAFEYFDFVSWAESKLSEKPFAEIVKGKAERDRR